MKWYQMIMFAGEVLSILIIQLLGSSSPGIQQGLCTWTLLLNPIWQTLRPKSCICHWMAVP